MSNKQLEQAQQHIIDLQVEITNLRAAQAAATQRAEAAEARALAATQQWVIARTQLESVHDYAIYYMDAWEVFEADSDGPEPLDFTEWLAQQSEAQP